MQYGASSEVQQMTYTSSSGYSFGNLQAGNNYTESRTYNTRLQMTRLTVAGALDMEYRYSATQNNGQITQQKDWISGEEVNYTYDSLQRLIAATTTDPSWGQSFSYDGFGNRTAATVTKGSAPSSSMSYDSATNRIIGSLYDANGNLTSPQSFGASYAYDVENRLTSAISANEFYAYASDNKRIWKRMPNGNQELYFYGISGQKLATYSLLYQSSPTQFVIATLDVNVYFGSKTIVSRGVTPLLDRLGSNRAGGSKYFPYGEEQQVTAGDRDKFATYYRDQTTGLDYAQNRYYANTMGRFLSPDPYMASAGSSDPGSWNRYSYVSNDPINYYDPVGLLQCNPDDPTCQGYYGGTAPDPQHFNRNAEYADEHGDGSTQGKGSPEINNVERSKATDLTWAGIRAVFLGGSDPDCQKFFNAAYLSSQGTQYGSLDNFLGNIIPSLTGVGDFSGSGTNAVANNSQAPGYLIVVANNGAFFNVLPRGQSLAPSNKYQAQFDAIQGSSDQARVFILLHELAHVFGAIRTNDGASEANQRFNNDVIWDQCNKTISDFSNNPPR